MQSPFTHIGPTYQLMQQSQGSLTSIIIFESKLMSQKFMVVTMRRSSFT